LLVWMLVLPVIHFFEWVVVWEAQKTALKVFSH